MKPTYLFGLKRIETDGCTRFKLCLKQQRARNKERVAIVKSQSCNRAPIKNKSNPADINPLPQPPLPCTFPPLSNTKTSVHVFQTQRNKTKRGNRMRYPTDRYISSQQRKNQTPQRDSED